MLVNTNQVLESTKYIRELPFVFIQCLHIQIYTCKFYIMIYNLCNHHKLYGHLDILITVFFMRNKHELGWPAFTSGIYIANICMQHDRIVNKLSREELLFVKCGNYICTRKEKTPQSLRNLPSNVGGHASVLHCSKCFFHVLPLSLG